MNQDRVELTSEARERFIQEMMNIYRQRQARLAGRKVEFLRKNPDAQNDVVLLVGGASLSSAAMGGLCGAIIGGSCGTAGGPPGMLLGAAVGIPVGAAVGMAIGTAITVIYLRPRYQEWCKTEAGIEFAGNLSIFLCEDSLLQHVLCPISHMPVIEGVRTPDGQLYEKVEIENWLKDHDTNPLTRAPLSKKDLIPDPEATAEATKIFINFLKAKREETKQIAPHLIEGYDRLINDHREAAMQLYNKHLVILQKRWREGKISYEVFMEKTKEIADKYLNL